MRNNLPEKIYSLDVLRGFAALVVIFWHWQHFFYVDYAPHDFNITSQPFYNIFPILYHHGLYAVELFFCISGFIFFWLYRDKIRAGEINLKNYLTKRLSRLYPLIFISTVMIFFLQKYYSLNHEYYFVYKFNDLYHFILNLTFSSSWGFEKGFSFNGPVWSVSIEMLLYLLFFIAALNSKRIEILSLLLVTAGYYLLPQNYSLSVGLFSFFSGGLSYLLCKHLLINIKIKTLTILSVFLCFSFWICVYLFSINDIFMLSTIGFNSIIISLVCISCLNNLFLKELKFLGDISYSIYLIHFPLQIVFKIISEKLGYTSEIFYDWRVFIAFFITLITISIVSHYKFEMPIQKMIRNRTYFRV